MSSVFALIAAAIYSFTIRSWMLDDAFISFRYADNFVQGHGLVFNVGERVGGYTNFLWVLLLVFGKTVGLPIVAMSRILGSLFALGTLALVVFSWRYVSDSSRLAAASAVLILSTCAVFTAWPGSGMEVCLFAFLILLAVLLYTSELLVASPHTRYLLTGLCLALVIMTRPEGALLAVVILSHSLFRTLRAGARSFAWLLIALAAIYAPYFVWRYSYYGYLLPNTFYAKVASTLDQVLRGSTYVNDWLVICWPLLALAVIGAYKLRGRGSTFVQVSSIYCALHIIYVIGVGGDIMPAFRFLAPIIPLLAILAGIGAASMAKRPVVLVLVIILVCGYNLLQMSISPHIAGHIKGDRVAAEGREVGLWLKAHTPAGTLIATNTAGTIPFYSELPTIDMFGLNDVHIAHRQMPFMGEGAAGHEKTDGAYIVSRRPAIIQFHSSLGGAIPWFVSDREVYAQPDFRAEYEGVAIRIPSLDTVAYFCVRRDFRFNP